jgi:hypothetical protein
VFSHTILHDLDPSVIAKIKHKDISMAAEDRGPQVAGVAIGFLTCTWVFVALRCYVRVFMTKAFGTDDWLSVISLVSSHTKIQLAYLKLS